MQYTSIKFCICCYILRITASCTHIILHAQKSLPSPWPCGDSEAKSELLQPLEIVLSNKIQNTGILVKEVCAILL